MRRKISLCTLFLISIFLLKTVSTEAGYNPGLDPQTDEEYYDVEFMGEYIDGGVMVEGSTLRTSYPYLDYKFLNITRNGEKIKAKLINTTFASDNVYTYEFDVKVSDEFLLIQPESYEGMYSQILTSTGEIIEGTFSLTSNAQMIHVIYNPEMSISESMKLNYDCQYNYVFTPAQGGDKLTGTISFQQEMKPFLSDQTNSSNLEFSEVLQKIESPNVILMYESGSSYNGTDNNGNDLWLLKGKSVLEKIIQRKYLQVSRQM